MRIAVEVAEQTRVWVHDLQPVILPLQAEDVYVLRDKTYLDAPTNGLIAVFLDRERLESLYTQIKEILGEQSLTATTGKATERAERAESR